MAQGAAGPSLVKARGRREQDRKTSAAEKRRIVPSTKY
jgi:hypothetical protein